jgi:hypothetical protein
VHIDDRMAPLVSAAGDLMQAAIEVTVVPKAVEFLVP